jgi:SAM-dependent methyltransferase
MSQVSQTPLRLNVGCGFDIRPGYVNIDGSAVLPGVDKVIDLRSERLPQHYSDNSVDEVVAQDFVEHHFHWRAVELLEDFHRVLRPGGRLWVRVPDTTRIILDPRISISRKIVLMYGGQDKSQGKGDEVSRKMYPEFFCHMYGWTRREMKAELTRIGFRTVKTQAANTNFIAEGIK